MQGECPTVTTDTSTLYNRVPLWSQSEGWGNVLQTSAQSGPVEKMQHVDAIVTETAL